MPQESSSMKSNTNTNNKVSGRPVHFSETCEVVEISEIGDETLEDEVCGSPSTAQSHGKGSSKFMHHSQPQKISVKALEKKASLMKKKHKGSNRKHTKSCSHGDEWDPELEGIVASLRRSAKISDAKISSGQRRSGTRYWGKVGDEFADDCRPALDEKDPNYDSEIDDHAIMSEMNFSVSITKSKFEELFNGFYLEYFDHGEKEEVCQILYELSPKTHLMLRVPYLAISLALERKNYERELTSEFLSLICDGHLLNHSLMEQAFNLILLEELKELTIDAPDAPSEIGKFIARAIADDVIPPKYLENFHGKVPDENAELMEAVKKADSLLSMPHCYALLDNVWHVRGLIGNNFDDSQHQPTRRLSHLFKLTLQEFRDAKDFNEVHRTIVEINAPHFHHEIVYRGLKMVIEVSTERVAADMIQLFEYLYTSGLCSTNHFNLGIRRIFRDLPDISIDVPAADLILDRFFKLAIGKGFLPTAIAKEMPQAKKRGRFISESAGDTPRFAKGKKASRKPLL